jgi:hypothetical protein
MTLLLFELGIIKILEIEIPSVELNHMLLLSKYVIFSNV